MTQDASPPAKRLRTDTTGSSRTATAQHLVSASCEENADCLAYDTVGAVCVDALGEHSCHPPCFTFIPPVAPRV